MVNTYNRVARPHSFIHNKESETNKSQNERNKDLRRRPWELNPTPSEPKDDASSRCDHKEVSTWVIRVSSHLIQYVRRAYISLATYIQSMCPSFSRRVPGGVGSLRKTITIAVATPQMGKLRSAYEKVRWDP